MTDEAAIRLATDLASGLITMDQVRAAGLEDDEVAEQCCKDHTCPVWLKDHPKDKAKRVKILTVEEWKSKISKEEPANPCAGCKFRKYHDWAEPTWTGFSAHYYDCENPSCPSWSRLWWRNNDDGSPLEYVPWYPNFCPVCGRDLRDQNEKSEKT